MQHKISRTFYPTYFLRLKSWCQTVLWFYGDGLTVWMYVCVVYMWACMYVCDIQMQLILEGWALVTLVIVMSVWPECKHFAFSVPVSPFLTITVFMETCAPNGQVLQQGLSRQCWGVWACHPLQLHQWGKVCPGRGMVGFLFLLLLSPQTIFPFKAKAKTSVHSFMLSFLCKAALCIFLSCQQNSEIECRFLVSALMTPLGRSGLHSQVSRSGAYLLDWERRGTRCNPGTLRERSPHISSYYHQALCSHICWLWLPQLCTVFMSLFYE